MNIPHHSYSHSLSDYRLFIELLAYGCALVVELIVGAAKTVCSYQSVVNLYRVPPIHRRALSTLPEVAI